MDPARLLAKETNWTNPSEGLTRVLFYEVGSTVALAVVSNVRSL